LAFFKKKILVTFVVILTKLFVFDFFLLYFIFLFSLKKGMDCILLISME
jgi:hypothetical protein